MWGGGHNSIPNTQETDTWPSMWLLLATMEYGDESILIKYFHVTQQNKNPHTWKIEKEKKTTLYAF